MKRSRCAAAHKAMWHAEWHGYPSDEFLSSLDDRLVKIKQNMSSNTYTSDTLVGNLSAKWAKLFNLPQNVKVGVGLLDAHAGAVGAGIKEGTLVKVIGTSTCDMAIQKTSLNRNEIPGICGEANGSILPNFTGLEAGQSAFGDIFSWYKNLLLWPTQNINPILAKELDSKILELLNSKLIELESLEAGDHHKQKSIPFSTDWFNGRRSPFADPKIKGSIHGLDLASTAPEIFRALILGACFGSKAITEHFKTQGVKINKIAAVGGIAKKSSYVMQMLSDAIECPIEVIKSDQACALGSAIYASVVGGAFTDISLAIEKISSPSEKSYFPRSENFDKLNQLYKKYQEKN